MKLNRFFMIASVVSLLGLGSRSSLALGAVHQSKTSWNPQSEATSSGPKYWLGAEIGPQFTDYRGKNTDDLDSSVHYRVGGSFDADLYEHFSVSTGLYWSHYGAELSQQGYKVKIATSSLQVPILGKGYFLRRAVVAPYVLGGMGLNYVVSSKASADLANGSSTEISLMEYTKRFDLMGLIGGGALIEATSQVKIKTELMYQHGFLKVFNRGSSAYNTAFLVSVGAMVAL